MCVSSSVVFDSLQPHGLQPTRLLCPWNSPGMNTGMDCQSLLQGILPTQGTNLHLLYCRQILYHLSHQGSPNTYMFLILQVFLAPTSFSRYYLASLLAFIAKFFKRDVDIYCFNCCLSLWNPLQSDFFPMASLWFFPKNSSCPGYLTYLPHIWLAVQQVAISFYQLHCSKNKQKKRPTIYLRTPGLFSSSGVGNHS